MALEAMDAFFNTRADTYDKHMLDDLKLKEFYAAITACFPSPVAHLLDLGCGTGLQLAGLFAAYPNMTVTGIDMSAEMLGRFKAKYPDKSLRLICGSYFDENFGGPHDAVLSTYSLHHFTANSKQVLYAKIRTALIPGGMFVLGDYTAATIEQQQVLMAENEAKRREQSIPEGAFYHFDTPLTAQAEVNLLKAAGFASVEILRQWDNTSIIAAQS